MSNKWNNKNVTPTTTLSPTLSTQFVPSWVITHESCSCLTAAKPEKSLNKFSTIIVQLAETLGDPYKGQIPLPSVPNYQARDLTCHLTRTTNTPNLNRHEYFPNGNHMTQSYPTIFTE